MRLEAFNQSPAVSNYAGPLARNTNSANSPTALPSKEKPSASAADQVSLSDAGRALAQQGQQALDAGEKILGDLTRQTLTSLGISSKADALGAKIEFDSFTYSAKSTTSFSATRSLYQAENGQRQESASLQFRSEQQTEITGRGRITTADGRTFEFESQLQVANSREFSQSIASNDSQASAGQSSEPNSAQNIAALRGPAAQFAKNSALFSVIDDILNQIQAGKLGAKLDDTALAENTAGTAPKATTPQGIAVGEPNPNASSGLKPSPNKVLNLDQLQDGAARIARQLAQFDVQPSRAEAQFATAA